MATSLGTRVQCLLYDQTDICLNDQPDESTDHQIACRMDKRWETPPLMLSLHFFFILVNFWMTKTPHNCPLN